MRSATHYARPTPASIDWQLSAPIQSPVDIARLVLAIDQETDIRDVARFVQREACRITRSTEALCVMFDWAHRRAWTVEGHVVSAQLQDLVADVAGSGHRAMIDTVIVEPIGRAPARAVLVVRRQVAYETIELAQLAALATGVAGTIGRLLSARP